MTSENQPEVTIAVTGLGWMGGDVNSVQFLMERALDMASDQVQIAAYRITDGASELFQALEALLMKGVRVSLLVNRLSDQPPYTQELTRNLAERYAHFHLLSFEPANKLEDLHAKLLVVDRSSAIVGSSNLTWKGLLLNHEIALMVSGPPASKLADLFDKLARDHRTRSVN